MRDAGMTFIPEIAKKSERCAKGIEIIQNYMKTQGYIK
jgi:hypothetical protein